MTPYRVTITCIYRDFIRIKTSSEIPKSLPNSLIIESQSSTQKWCCAAGRATMALAEHCPDAASMGKASITQSCRHSVLRHKSMRLGERTSADTASLGENSFLLAVPSLHIIKSLLG